MMWATALVATLAVLAAYYYYLAPPNDHDLPSQCPHDKEACFFSENYVSARSQFREAAVSAGAELHELRISSTPDLTIDVAVLDPQSQSQSSQSSQGPPTVVHLSGVHGVEGYAGSAVQLALPAWLGLGHSTPPAAAAGRAHCACARRQSLWLSLWSAIQ